MSKRLLAIKVSEFRYATFIENVTIEEFNRAFDNITYSSTSNDIVIHLNSDKTMSRLSLSSHFESYPDMELIKYRGNFHTEIYPRFKELLFQSTLVKPKKETMEEYKVSKDFILEAHKAACATWKSKLEEQFPDAFSTYKTGDRFNRAGSNYEYMLACTGKYNHVTMINITTGDRFGDEYQVNNIKNITETELILLVEGEANRKDFKLKQ